MTATIKTSPNSAYVEALRAGHLAYQVTSDGRPVFFPRVIAPGSGEGDLEWRVSGGVGTVYSTSVVHRRNEPPLNVVLVDLDEGFRMMSRVEGLAAASVTIGMRVKVRIVQDTLEGDPLPVFEPMAETPAKHGARPS